MSSLRRRGAVLALGAALAAAACTASTPPPEPAPTGAPSPTAAPSPAALAADRFQILHTNDIHGRLDSTTITTGAKSFEQGGLALLGGMIERQRARAPQRTLTLDAGDAMVGTLISAADKGQSLIKAMSVARYDALALGNHDFDWGQEEIAKRAREASFPFLTANVVEEASGRTPPFAKPYVVKDVGIARVGIIGVTYPSSSIINAKGIRGLKFGSAIEGVRRWIGEVRQQADVIVVLSHNGIDGGSARLEGDSTLAQIVTGIDVIIAGHDHRALRTAQTVGTTKIFQTGANAENLGRVEVTIDPATKKVAAVTGSDVLLTVATGAAPPHPEIAKIVADRRAEADKYSKRVVGRTTEFLAQDREMNNPLGNFVADALLDYGRKQGWNSDIAFYNSAGVRAPIGIGEVTYGKLFEVLPFGNTLVSVDLTGEQLKEVFEGMAGAAGRLFMSGGTMRYRFANAAGQRVTAATVGGQPLDPKRTYHVITIDYLHNGGDGHTGFAKGTNVIYGDIELDAVATYFEAKSPIAPTSPGRVVQE